ncbi:MAG: cytochrome c oxidase subunit II [Acidobacteriota bacterium]
MAALMAFLIWITTIVIVVLFSLSRWDFPQLISQYIGIDTQFYRTLIVVGIAFVGSHLALGWYIFKYGKGGTKALYSHGNTKVEVGFTALTAVVFIITAFLGQRTWYNLHINDAPADAIQIEVTGQQFAWSFRYPGPDGKFGETKPELIKDPDNLVGIDPNDPAGKDDIQNGGRMVVPVNRPVKLILRSKDVTHNFFVPQLRFKQDTVPGMKINVHFIANKVGEYEIACSELCGLGHYKMRAVFEVKEYQDYQKWLEKLSGQ